MPRQVVQIDKIGLVTFSKNRRSKNIKLSVKPDKSVLVSFPYYASKKEVLLFVAKNEAWIKQQQHKMDGRKTKVGADTVIQSKIYTIRFGLADKNRVSKNRNELKISVPDFDSEQSQAYIEKCLTEIYRFEAKHILPKRLKELAAKHGFSYSRVTIRNNRRNWGSCSSQNNISLNLQMIKLPNRLIDYILLHELVHTEIKDHSAKFWRRLDEVSENRAKMLSKEVQKYSTYAL